MGTEKLALQYVFENEITAFPCPLVSCKQEHGEDGTWASVPGARSSGVQGSAAPTVSMTPAASWWAHGQAGRPLAWQTLHMATTKQPREWLGLSAIIMTSFSPEAFKSLLNFFMINWRHFAALHLQKWLRNEIIRRWNTSCAYWFFFLTSSASVSKNMEKILIFFMAVKFFCNFFSWSYYLQSYWHFSLTHN